MNEPKWENAPVWADYFGYWNGYSFWVNDEKYLMLNSDNNTPTPFKDKGALYKDNIVSLETRPAQPKEVKEWDPKKGFRALYNNVNYWIAAIDDGEAWIKEVTNDIDHIPLKRIVDLDELSQPDTRTDKQKAIECMQYAYDKGQSMEDVFSEMEKGYIHEVKFTGDK